MGSATETYVTLTWPKGRPRASSQLTIALLTRDRSGAALPIARAYLAQLAAHGWEGTDLAPADCLVGEPHVPMTFSTEA